MFGTGRRRQPVVESLHFWALLQGRASVGVTRNGAQHPCLTYFAYFFAAAAFLAAGFFFAAVFFLAGFLAALRFLPVFSARSVIS